MTSRRLLTGEIAAVIRASPSAAFVQAALAAALCLAVLLTLGQSAGSRQAVLNTLDDEGTRQILIRAASEDAGLTTAALNRINHLDAVDVVFGLSAATDGYDPTRPGSAAMPVRTAHGDVHALGLTTPANNPADAGLAAFYGTDLALQSGGLPDRLGFLKLADGTDAHIRPGLQLPPYLAELEPLTVRPTATTERPDRLAIIVVLASDATEVDALTAALPSMLAVSPQDIRISTSTSLASIRSLLDADLGAAGRSIVLSSFAIMAVLVMMTTFAQARTRRKEFGRRRALGATRTFVLLLLWGQATALAAAGAISGVAAATVILWIRNVPTPGPSFAVAVTILTVTSVSIACVIPAAIASRQDPVRELRVP